MLADGGFRERCNTEERLEYGLGDEEAFVRGLGRRWAGTGECELTYEDCARMSSTASSAKIWVECASISAREGSTRNSVGCSVERRIWE